jgi:serine/threonine protein kinase
MGLGGLKGPMDTDTFVSQLWQLGLLYNRRMERAVNEGLARGPDARSLARELIQQNMLTPFQANQILTGKGPTLVVGKYRLMERLGQGSLGHSYKAVHMAMDRLVTLRRLPPEMAADPKARARFQRVVQILAHLEHPNLPAAFDAFEEGGVAVLVMEYVEGTRLDQRVRKEGPLPIALACHVVRQAALALQYVYEPGLKCSHVQPSGILLAEPAPGKYAGPHLLGAVPAERPVVKIVDLGLALPAAGGTPIHQHPDNMGPADFVAPEQVSSRPVVDLRTLVYRLGGILYFALTGRTPFPEGQAWAKLLRHQFQEPEPVERFRPEVPATLAGLLRRMLTKQPEHRFQTLTEAASELAGFGSPDEARVPST